MILERGIRIMIKPKPLKKGDRVALIAPSSPVNDEKFKLSLNSINYIGLEPVVFKSCTLKHGYLAGKDEERAADINSAFKDPSINGIFCLRGGYGVTRLLNLLDYKAIAENPKLFLGYSDITGLHTVLNQKCNLATLHSPMPTRGWDTLDSLSLDVLNTMLFESKPLGIVPTPDGEPLETVVDGVAEGIITGGNLSLLAGTLGSPYEIDTNGKILFFEDVDEKHYRLDKAITALALAGKFSDCAGVIVGTFANSDDPDVKEEDNLPIRQIIEEVIVPFKKPTLNNFRAGHVYPNISIPMGTTVKLDATNQFVEYLESFTES